MNRRIQDQGRSTHEPSLPLVDEQEPTQPVPITPPVFVGSPQILVTKLVPEAFVF